MKIWDGTSPTRKDISHANAPRYDDYMKIVSEIQGIQRYLLDATKNIELMPDLQGHLDAAKASLTEITTLISNITPPVDLKAVVDGFQEDLKAIDIRDQMEDVRASNDVNAKAITEVQILSEQLTAGIRQELIGLKNQTRNDLHTFKQETAVKFKQYDAEIARLNRLLNIKAELTRLSS